MVLSLPLVLALVGSATGLIIGMLIFGEVSDALVCPTAGSGGGGGGGPITAVGKYFEENIQVPFNALVAGIIGQAAYQEGISTAGDQGEIRYGVPSDWTFLHKGSTGSDLVSMNFWIKGDVVGGPSYPLIDNKPCSFYDLRCVTYGGTVVGSPNGFLLYAQSGFIAFRIFENNVERLASSFIVGPPNNGVWHMITVSYDKGAGSNVATICMDAVCSTTGIQTFTGVSPDSLSTLSIGTTHGCCGGTTENGFAVDELTIWHGYRLTPTDATTLYNGGAGLSSSGISPGTQVLYDTFEGTAPATPEVAGETGAEQCLQAKDTAWTVIAILPVALFFGLFAIFSSLGVTRPT